MVNSKEVRTTVQKNKSNSKREMVWLVDYDLPVHESCRQDFYRQVRKVMNETGLANTSSSKSVIVTKNEKTAQTVYNLAKQCGRAHLYEAKQVNP
jgi:spermidine synthase